MRSALKSEDPPTAAVATIAKKEYNRRGVVKKRAGKVAKDKHVLEYDHNGASIRDTNVAHPRSADSKSASQSPLHIGLSYKHQAAATQDCTTWDNTKHRESQSEPVVLARDG